MYRTAATVTRLSLFRSDHRRWLSISRMLDMGGVPSSFTDKNLTRTVNASKHCTLQAICFDFETLTKSIDKASASPTRASDEAPLSKLGQVLPDASKVEHIANLLNVNLVSNDRKQSHSRLGDDLSLLTGEQQQPLKPQQQTVFLTDIRSKYVSKLLEKGVSGGIATVELNKHLAESALKRGDAAGHLAARKLVASEPPPTSSSTKWMAQTGTGSLLQYLTHRSIQIALLPSRPLSKQLDEKEAHNMESLQNQLHEVVFDLLVKDGTLSATDILVKTIKCLKQESKFALLVSGREEYLQAAKELGWMTCRIRPKNAPRGHISTTYMVPAVPDVKQVVDEINGISYSAVLKSR